MSTRAETTESFNDAYQKLSEAADKLSQSEDLDIDGLIGTVQQATDAAKICQRRLKAVDKALAELLQGSQEG